MRPCSSPKHASTVRRASFQTPSLTHTVWGTPVLHASLTSTRVAECGLRSLCGTVRVYLSVRELGSAGWNLKRKAVKGSGGAGENILRLQT